MSPIARPCSSLSSSIAFGGLLAWILAAPPLPAQRVARLETVMDTGVVIRDRNGDGVVDFLDLRIVLPRAPTAVEAAAAANLAARLGFETAATDLGLAALPGVVERVGGPRARPPTFSTPVLAVGDGALEVLGVAVGAASFLEELAPGQGVVALLPAVGSLGEGGVAVLGRDDTGLMAAASYLAARFPSVWAPEGVRWSDVADKVRAVLREKMPGGIETVLDRVVVDARRPGVSRARVTLEPSGLQEPAHLAAALKDAGVAQALEFPGLHRLDLRWLEDGQERTATLRPRRAWELREEPPFRPPADAAFSLPAFYQVGGIYRDSNRDLVPDELAAYLSIGAGAPAGGVVDLATRIGLETAGIRLPLARVDAQEDDPAAGGLPILVGAGHYQIRRLDEEGKLGGVKSGKGVGFIRLVDRAFGERGVVAVGGGDEPGVEAAIAWLSGRAPYLWHHGKGEYRLADLETEVRRFFQARQAPGQMALALAKLESWLEETGPEPPRRIEVELATNKAPPGLRSVAETMVREQFPESEASVRTWATGFGVGDTVFVEEWDIPWEVDEVREILTSQVYPHLRPDLPARIEIRISEPLEVRRQVAEEIRREMARRGVSEGEVQVLSAYKQGYFWIVEVVLPRLRLLPVASISLVYHTLEESDEVRWQIVEAESRWLQEVYPFDAVLARELGIPDSVITFHPTRRREPIYTLEARDADGKIVYRDEFHPRYVVRPLFDLFPEYEQVRVTTGWITALSGADTLVDRRVATDPERFWDRLQTRAYGRLVEYVMDSQEGDPVTEAAPYFDEFQVDLRLSEPNERIGVDEELVSSLEALHEDIFFETHTLFTLLGGRYQTTLSYPGRVLPYMDPTGTGRPGWARVSLTGKERGKSKLLLRTWRGDASDPELREYFLSALPAPTVSLVGASVAHGEEGLRSIVARVTARDSLDRSRELRLRAPEAVLDRELTSVGLLQGMLRALARLKDQGVSQEVLSWDRVGELIVEFRVEGDSLYRRYVSVPRSGSARSTENPRLAAGSWRWDGGRIVQWDTPISPAEHDTLLARLATFPEVQAYYLTDSYLGHRVWAADILPPHEGRYVSQAKLNALRPTLMVSGREHANEVSSTSHILRLAELLATDSTWRPLLNRVNVVIHPMTNPDGAEVAYRRQLVNPHHMLHIGRPGALGVDVTAGGGTEDPVYPEAQARPMLREAWLPDIFLNPHGYPSHEWVQLFAGYSAWVRGRRVGPRTWWIPRGWFIPGFTWVDDKENPAYRRAQFAILDSMAAAMTEHEEIHAFNRRLYARYRKYGIQEREGFTEYFHNGMLVNLSLRGQESIGTGVNSARITYFSVTTEAPDETARGDYLRLMGEMGLAHVGAALRYLAQGDFKVEREVKAYQDAVVRKVYRLKPVLPREGVGGGPPPSDG